MIVTIGLDHAQEKQMSDNDGCIWCNAYEYAKDTLGYSDDAAANYATLYEANATKS